MSTDRNQSAIREVRDQLSLDYADGKYLNNASSNLGVNRPIFGFTDDRWRALVKELALDYKQVATKFHDVLATLFGPKQTEVTTLSADAPVGSLILHVNNTDHLPQLGFIVLDEGEASEETVEYCFVDYENKAVYLETELTAAHSAVDQDVEVPLVVVSGTDLYVPTTRYFPTTGFPVVAVVGRGTPEEEVVSITANDQAEGKLTLSGGLTNTHRTLQPTTIFSDLSRAYVPTSVFLEISDTTKFPEEGVVLLGPSASFTATGGTTTTATVAASTFTNNKQIHYRAVFDGNVTAAITGEEVEIIDNTDSSLTFATALSAAPVSGDTFSIRPVVDYVGNNVTEGHLNLRTEIFDLDLAVSARVELVVPGSTVALATAQVKGTDWDVIQATPRLVELYLPEILQDARHLRSASYIHGAYDSTPPSTTLSSAANPGDTTLSVGSVAGFPLVGVLTVDLGGVNEERHGYYVSGADLVLATTEVQNSHLSGETVDLYQPRYASTDLLSGNLWTVDDVWPGPYAYKLGAPAPTGTVAHVTLQELLPGPTTVAREALVGHTAVEVDSAQAFDLVGIPYAVLLGANTGNREEVTVSDINLKRRARTTVASGSIVGATELEVAALINGAADEGATFPDAFGYRVIVGRGTANEEVVFVVGTNTGPDRLRIQTPMVSAHSIGEDVELMSDVLTVDPLIDEHDAPITYDQRSTALAGTKGMHPVIPIEQMRRAEKVQPLISGIDVLSVAGMDTTGGRVLLNYANGLVKTSASLSTTMAPGSTYLQFADSSMFPQVYPYEVVISPGTAYEERALVTDNDTGLNRLEINNASYPMVNNHPSGDSVVWYPGKPEVLEYQSLDGNTIRFSTPIVLESTHSPGEYVTDSSEDSDPRDLGWDFPLRLPPDILTRIQYVLDLVRAAGVQVAVIDKR